MSAATFLKVGKRSKGIGEKRGEVARDVREEGGKGRVVNRRGTPISFPTLTALLPSGWQLPLMKAACKLAQETAVHVGLQLAYENNDK